MQPARRAGGAPAQGRTAASSRPRTRRARPARPPSCPPARPAAAPPAPQIRAPAPPGPAGCPLRARRDCGMRPLFTVLPACPAAAPRGPHLRRFAAVGCLPQSRSLYFDHFCTPMHNHHNVCPVCHIAQRQRRFMPVAIIALEHLLQPLPSPYSARCAAPPSGSGPAAAPACRRARTAGSRSRDRYSLATCDL